MSLLTVLYRYKKDCLKTMIEKLTLFLPYIVLLSHFFILILVGLLVFRNSWGKKLENFIGKYSMLLAFLISLSALIGSLFYSQIVGFEPCVLCWWQRVFIFPLPVIFGIAIWRKDRNIFNYVVPLAVLSAVVALYQSYVYLGGASFLPCTAVGGACSKVYVKVFGYITIPVMSLTISLYILFIAWIHNKYEKNRNA